MRNLKKKNPPTHLNSPLSLLSNKVVSEQDRISQEPQIYIYTTVIANNVIYY